MTLPKKGTRKIIVDGKTYRWRVGNDFNPEYGDYGTVIVEEPSGKIWKAYIPASYAAPKSKPSSEYHPNGGAIPSVIEDLIRHPEKREGVFSS